METICNNNNDVKEYKGIVGKELFKNVQRVISEIVTPENETDKFKYAKELIYGNMLELKQSEVEELFEFDIKDKFGFSAKRISMLVKYHKECMETRLARIKHDAEKQAKNNPVEQPREEIKDLDEDKFTEREKLDALKEAKDIMKNGAPFEYIMDELKSRHVGDEWAQQAIAIAIANQSCLNSHGLNVTFNGDSGDGKSHLVNTHMMLIPEMFKLCSSLSAKSLYYAGISAGTVVFFDDVEPDEATQDTIKRSSTNYQSYTKHTTVKDGESKTIQIPPRILWLRTSVNSTASTEVLNREIQICAEKTPEHKIAIFNKQKDEYRAARLGDVDITFKTLVCRNIYRAIKTKTFNVEIPFVDKISFADYSNARITGQFYDMIIGFAIFNHEQRQVNEKGNLVAEIQDFYYAKDLFESQQEGAVSKLSERERGILNYISNNPDCTIKEIMTGIRDTEQNIKYALAGRQDRGQVGLLGKVQGLSSSDDTVHEDTIKKVVNGFGTMDVNVSRGRRAKTFHLNGWKNTEYVKSGFVFLKE